jgi:hypothetical protein
MGNGAADEKVYAACTNCIIKQCRSPGSYSGPSHYMRHNEKLTPISFCQTWELPYREREISQSRVALDRSKLSGTESLLASAPVP